MNRMEPAQKTNWRVVTCDSVAFGGLRMAWRMCLGSMGLNFVHLDQATHSPTMNSPPYCAVFQFGESYAFSVLFLCRSPAVPCQAIRRGSFAGSHGPGQCSGWRLGVRDP